MSKPTDDTAPPTDDTAPPAEPRKSTGIVKIEAEVAEKRIDADLEVRKLEIADRDKARDDRRATVRTILLWSTGFVGTVGALVLLGLAIYYRADFHFSGFGINAGTTQTTTTIAADGAVSTTTSSGAPTPEPAPLPAPDTDGATP